MRQLSLAERNYSSSKLHIIDMLIALQISWLVDCVHQDTQHRTPKFGAVLNLLGTLVNVPAKGDNDNVKKNSKGCASFGAPDESPTYSGLSSLV